MALITLKDIDLGYGGPLLIEKATFSIEQGERVCLLGRNGSGKTTLMKFLSGDLEELGGQITVKSGLKTARLIQQVPDGIQASVYQEVTNGLGKQGVLINEYHNLTLKVSEDPDNLKHLNRLEVLSHEIDAAGGWDVQQQVDTVISKMKLDPEAMFDSLSAGLKRRVHLAKALVSNPDMILLDEPTNHLDIESIDWLEKFLEGCNITLLFITHDRSFLKKLATRIIEIDRGVLTSYSCNYDTYLTRKQEMLEVEIANQAKFDKRLAEEEIWIRKGIQGRRTRNEGRVRALKKMREERRERKSQQGRVKFELQESQLSGQLVIESKGLDFSYGDLRIVKDLSLKIMRGDKIGIIGPNGAGKTTLISLLLGKLSPDAGSVRHGTNLEVAYFDQLHSQLDEDKSVVDNVADGYKTITINGNSRSVYGYLQDFLFLPERANSLVSVLSGGERNRLLLAKIFLKPSNVLVLDEPTNDLDIETLELLEEMLQMYPGTVLMVSHDRQFLNNVVTSSLVFDGNGEVKEYVGGYDDYIRQRANEKTEEEASKPKQATKPRAEKKRKLSYNEKRELEDIPAKIELLDQDISDIHSKMADPDFYKESPELISSTTSRLKLLEEELEKLYTRWEELEAIEQ